MKKELIVTGKTVEEARKKAAAQLGVAEEEMIVTVLEEGKKGRGYVIDCAIDADEMVHPMVGGGHHITEFMLY